jgi:hypothetical protein
VTEPAETAPKPRRSRKKKAEKKKSDNGKQIESIDQVAENVAERATSVSADGQPLVQTDANKRPAPEPARDPLHEGVMPRSVGEGPLPVPEVVAPLPSVEQIAEAHQRGAVPRAETDPQKAHDPVMDPNFDVHGDYQPDEKILTLRDLMRHFGRHLQDGQYEVHVERKQPSAWGGVPCRGVQRPIKRYMTDADFAAEYGGGKYILRLYGPPKRGVVDPETRRIRPVALTSPISYELSVERYPPSLQSADLHVGPDGEFQEDEEMQSFRPAYSPSSRDRPATAGDARIVESQLTHEREMEERRRDREERERARDEERRRSQLDPLHRMVDNAQSQLLRTMEEGRRERERDYQQRLEHERERADEERDRAKDAASRPTDLQAFGSTVATLLAAVQPKDDGGASQQALESLRSELARVMEGSRTELQRAADGQRQELERRDKDHIAETKRTEDRCAETVKRAEERLKETEERAERRIREADEKAEGRIKAAEQQVEDRIKTAESRSEKLVRDVKDELTKGIAEAHRQSQQRLDDERRQHDRDMKAKAETHEMRMDSQKGVYENRISTLNDTVNQLRVDVERFRAEAESAKDIPTQVEKLRKTAEAIGMSDNPGGAPAAPESWGEVAMQLATSLGPQLPDLVANAGEAVRAARGQPPAHQAAAYSGYGPPQERALPPPLHGADGGALQAPRMEFGTEDVEYDGDSVAPPQAPIPVGAPPPGSPAIPQPSPADEQARMFPQAPPPAYPGSPAPPPQQQAPPQPAPQRPQRPQAPPQQQAAPQGAPPQGVITAEQILGMKPQLESAIASGMTPDEVAEDLIGQVGPEMALGIARMVSVERIASVVQQSPGGAQSPLVRRDGQKFLRELWQAVVRRAGG